MQLLNNVRACESTDEGADSVTKRFGPVHPEVSRSRLLPPLPALLVCLLCVSPSWFPLPPLVPSSPSDLSLFSLLAFVLVRCAVSASWIVKRATPHATRRAGRRVGFRVVRSADLTGAWASPFLGAPLA